MNKFKYFRLRKEFIKNGKYWRDRSVQSEAAKQRANEKTFNEIERIYRNAQKELDAEIDKWYARIAVNNDISLADAKKLLDADQLREFHWDVNEYIEKCKEAGIYGGRWSKQLENASAKVHISRLEALKIRTQQSLEMLYSKEHNMLKNAFSDAYKTGYYQSFFTVQKAAGIGFDVGTVDQNTLDKVLYKPWAADGRNFSERIWGNKTQLVDTLHKEMTQHILLGQSVEKTASRIAADAVRRGSPALSLHDKVADKMRTAKMNARRLVQTESAYFHSQGQKQMFSDLDVEQYEYVATIDSRTTEICSEMNGKVFNMKDYETGVTAPPLHVNCRSTTAPYFDDEFELELEAEQEACALPDKMSYKQWENAFVAGGSKSGLEKVAGDTQKQLTNGGESGKIKNESVESQIEKLEKLKQSGMAEDDYGAYLKIINNHENPGIVKLYKNHADEISEIKQVSGGKYLTAENSIVFSYPSNDDMNKFGILAHEYGHFFDKKVKYGGLHFTEMAAVRDATELTEEFKDMASSSDEFLTAVRKDQENIKSLITGKAQVDLLKHNASHGVQDAINWLFPKSRFKWRHSKEYYDRKYECIESAEAHGNPSIKKKLQKVYSDLKLDASDPTKIQAICRQYGAASEIWANVMSSEVCGGAELEYIKKYLPNSYKAMLDILKGAK